MNKKIALPSLVVIFNLFFIACVGLARATQVAQEKDDPAVPGSTAAFPTNPPASTGALPTAPLVSSPTPTLTPTSAPTSQPDSQTQGVFGPQIENFPPGINPLTGLLVTDPSLLDLPAILISIPLFPASARPQAGLSYAPWVFEIYIGEGTTRLLAVFYAESPSVEPPLTGSNAARTEPFTPGGATNWGLAGSA